MQVALMLVALAVMAVSGAVPVPNQRQLDFMGLETIQFMHFGIPTFWKPTDAFLHGTNPTYGGNCQQRVTGTSNDSQTAGGYWPCLNPDIFNPTELNVDNWMAASASLGMKEICLTAKHFGGFTLWPSNHTPYGVAASPWRGGKGDVLREFADAANRWGIKICYYCNPRDDGYLAQKMHGGKITAEEFEARQMGMLAELMDNYGPVNRFWFDGGAPPFKPNPESRPAGVNGTVYSKALELIRSKSPSTLVSPYTGDICSTIDTLYTNAAPAPNSTDPRGCTPAVEGGEYFHPSEMHGITIQEGDDGNTDARPTYWFWHEWACAGNVTGCPWVGHSNASRIFYSYIQTVGHGAVLNMNIPPTSSGQMNASVVQVMAEAGKAINDTFKLNNAGAVASVASKCTDGVASVVPTGEFDYIVSAEDLQHGQRIGNYSVEYRRKGSSTWEVLVPPVQAAVNTTASTTITASNIRARVADRPDGNDPRDSHVGYKRIDVPRRGVQTSGAGALHVAEVRFNCISKVIGAEGDDVQVYLKRFSLHKRVVPWE